MKLVQLLAKELKEWPESVVVYFQWGNGEVFATSKGAPTEYSGGMWYVVGRDIEMAYDAPMYDKRFDLAEDHDTATVNKSQWQAEREKMNKPKWIRHRRGNRCVDDDVFVEVKLRCGDVQRGEAKDFIWSHHCCDSAANIMAYRVIEETKDQEIEEVKKTNFGTITYKLEIDATDANKEIDSLVAKWGQIESPLKWRDEIIELEAYEEEFRREREKLIRKLESEGFNLIDHAPAKCLLDEWEAMDYESFCVGDTVVCIHEKPDDTIAELTIGKEYRLILDDEQICVIDDIGDPMRYCIEIGCFKLVKRA